MSLFNGGDDYGSSGGRDDDDHWHYTDAKESYVYVPSEKSVYTSMSKVPEGVTY